MAKKVVIDAGHGGSDPGTINNGIVEKDYTLKISQYIADRLKDLGVDASLSRLTDETLDPVNRPKKIQSFYGNGEDVIVISNHINAGGGDGAEVIYALRNSDTLAKKITKELELAGQNIRKTYQRRLPSNPAKDYYYIIRETPNNESLIIEYGFADSTGDDVAQLKNNWQQYAEAVVKALADYIGVNYIESTNLDYYTVSPGDTLWSIAKKNNISVDELKRINNLTNNLLSIGQKLLIKPNANNIDDNNTVNYIVKKGDNLYAIAKKYNVTVDSLKKENNIQNNLLSIGQQLIIRLPSTESSTNTHKVVSGDTLYNLAKRYNTTIEELKKVNSLTTDILKPDQLLVIPSSTSYITYTVSPGDTLYSISRTYGTSVSEIENLNNLDTSILSVGQKLLLPNKI